MCGCAGSITPLTPAGNDALQTSKTSSWYRSGDENEDDVGGDESSPPSDDDVDTDDELQPCKPRDLHQSQQAIV